MSEMQDFNKGIIDEFRANGGKVGGMFAGAPMLLLTTTGAKSGKPFTTPLVHTVDGDRIVIVASKAGAPSHPDWYYNLVKNPTVTVERGTETFEATASVAEDAERDRLFQQQAELMPNFREYQEKTSRVIPVVLLQQTA